MKNSSEAWLTYNRENYISDQFPDFRSAHHWNFLLLSDHITWYPTARRALLDNSRYKMEILPIHEHKSNLQNAIKPECELDSLIDNLLKNAPKEFSWDMYENMYELFGLW